MRIRPYLRCAGRLGLLPLICLSLRAAHAGSATWNLNATTNDWNSATNWTPATVPNATTDTATFGASNTTSVFTSTDVDLGSLVFTADAPSYTMTIGTNDFASLNFWGEGVRNDSGVEQAIIAPHFSLFHNSAITFHGTSTAGDNVTYFETGSFVDFNDNSSAGSATIYVNSFDGSDQADCIFTDNSTAADATIILGPFTVGIFSTATGGHPSAGNATITVLGGQPENPASASLTIDEGSTIDDATFIAEGTTAAAGSGGVVEIFNGTETLTGGTFIVNGSAFGGGLGGSGGRIDINGIPTDGTYTINGATAVGGESGEMIVAGSAGVGEPFVILNGGENGGLGGKLTISGEATGGTARVAAYGNGLLKLNLKVDSVTIGSIEGNGLIGVGKKNLAIGSNNLSTTFSGTIQDTGSINKIGTGTLTLTGANSYSGGTMVTGGILLVSNISGSGTGTGAISVNAGTLGGSGIIAGTVTVGTNTGMLASLAPSKGAKKPATLTIQSALTLNDDSTYLYKLDTKRLKADEVIANGVVIDSGAKFSLRPSGNNALTTGQVFSVISNTSASPIVGTFHNLRNGAIVTVNGDNLQASYTGGDGNDLTLTVVP